MVLIINYLFRPLGRPKGDEVTVRGMGVQLFT